MGEDSSFRENHGAFTEVENLFSYSWEDQSLPARPGGHLQEAERVQKDGDVLLPGRSWEYQKFSVCVAGAQVDTGHGEILSWMGWVRMIMKGCQGQMSEFKLHSNSELIRWGPSLKRFPSIVPQQMHFVPSLSGQSGTLCCLRVTAGCEEPLRRVKNGVKQ